MIFRAQIADMDGKEWLTGAKVVIIAAFPQTFHFLSSYQTFPTSSFICLGGTRYLCHIQSGLCEIL